jgi:hypothetical protein
MPLNEREKKELAKRIDEQRRAMWTGEVESRSQTREEKQGRGKIGQFFQRLKRGKKTIQRPEQPSDRLREKRKSRDTQSKIPALTLALIVIVSLIVCILIGVGIGYLAAVHGWIPM